MRLDRFLDTAGELLAIRSTAPVDSTAVRARVTSALVPFSRAAHVTAVGSPRATSAAKVGPDLRILARKRTTASLR